MTLLADFGRALAQLGDPRFRGVLWRSLAVVLLAFVALIFGLTVVKVQNGDAAALQGFDHQVRPALLPRDPGVEIRPSTDPVAAPGTPGAALPNSVTSPQTTQPAAPASPVRP